MHPGSPVSGAGLGLRRAHLGPLLDRIPDSVSFLELAPENWIGVGGRLGDALETIAAKTTLVSHGLLLNLGGLDPIDEAFVGRVGEFLDRYAVKLYGDHLTYCADAGQLYELLPMPFTHAAADYMADRIKQVQDRLGRQITVENASYYCLPDQQIDEIEFINRILDNADCLLLFDINNVYVNSVNHRYDPREFVRQIPGERIAYAHIAGHYVEAPDLIIDTHGADVIDPVWSLLEFAYQCFGVFPTMLERDTNIPDLDEVLLEVERINLLQQQYAPRQSRALP